MKFQNIKRIEIKELNLNANEISDITVLENVKSEKMEKLFFLIFQI